MAFQTSTIVGGLSVTGFDVDPNDGLPLDANGDAYRSQMQKVVTYNVCTNGSLGTTTFFIADRSYTITGVTYVCKVVGSVTGASKPTLNVTHETGTTASGSGTAVLSSAIDCHASTAATTFNGVLAPGAGLTLAAGDRLSVLFAGTLTALAGVVVSVYMVPSCKSETASIYFLANGDIATQTFFIAPRDIVVTGVSMVYGTAFATSTTLTVTKDTGTTACGGGTAILAAAQAVDAASGPGTATVVSPALTATAATLAMAAGDRLAAVFSATTTGANVCVTVSFTPLVGEQQVVFQIAPAAQQAVNQYFFVADRHYEVMDGSCVYDITAGTASKLAIEIEKGTTAPGSGVSVDTTNSNAGFDMNTTARTVQWIAPAVRHSRQLSVGDRLGTKWSASAYNTVLTCMTVTLIPK